MLLAAKLNFAHKSNCIVASTTGRPDYVSLSSCATIRVKIGCVIARASANRKGAMSNHGSSAQANPCHTDPAASATGRVSTRQ
jgi:hypothetical protein